MPTTKTYTETISTYDLNKTLKKLATQAGLVALIAVLTYFIDNGLPELMFKFPQYAAIIAVFSALTVATLNYLKHRKDTKTVKKDSETGEIVEVLN